MELRTSTTGRAPDPGFDRSPLAQAFVSASGVVSSANNALARMLRTGADEIVGTALARWFAGDAEATSARLALVLQRETPEGEPARFELQPSGKVPIPVRLHAAPSAEHTWVALETAADRPQDLEDTRDRLTRPQSRHEHVLDSLPVLAWGIDSEGTFLFSEGKALALLGYAPGEVVGQNIFELYAGVPEVIASVRRALSGEEYTSATLVGNRVWHTRYTPTLVRGSVRGVWGVSVDITEHDSAKAQLYDVREHLHSVVNAAPILLWSTDSEGRLQLVEGQGKFGSREEDLIGKRIHDVGSPGPEILRALDATLEGHDRTIITQQDGKTWENRFCPRRDAQGKITGIVGVSVDISDRTAAEHALEESRADRDALLECTHQMIFSLDHESRLVSWNSVWASAMREWLGFDPVAGMPLLRSTQEPEKRELWAGWYERALSGERFQVDYTIDHPPGPRQFEVSFTPIAERDPDGNPTGVVRGATCFMNDISKRKHAESALRESEEELRAIVYSVAEGVIATDAAECVVQMNPVAEALTGWCETDARGTRLDRLFEALAPETRTPESIPNDLGALPRNVLLVARDGRESHVAASLTGLRDAHGARRGSLLVLRDRSEEAAAEETLRQAHKMEAVGQLAAGIAHDFNNLLAGIMGHAELLEDRLAPGTDPGRHLEQIQEASSRAAHLTAQLLSFSRKSPLQRRTIDVHDVLEDALLLLERSVDRLIVLRRDFAATRSYVTGDPAQLQSAFLNLGLNARDALSAGGEISFSTRVVSLEASSSAVVSRLGAPGEYLEIRVTDTGMGMDPATMARIFEPFFTTKPEGQGTGLGLAGVYGCVEQHGGVIEVESQLGQGSCFRVILPLAPEDADPDEVADDHWRPPEAAVGDAVGHVLVIDDEETVRNLSRNALSLSGYTVTLAPDGAAGVEALRDASPPVDLVVLDMVMPLCSGEETFRALRLVDPELPILLVSGFSHSSSCEELLEEGALGLLPKPFRIDELRERVRRGIETRA